MNDDQLRDELERRANRAAAPDLLPAISPRLNDMSRPARVAGWAPLAGLAAAAVIVVALIIAWPRNPSLSGPAATATSAAATELECLLDGASTQITISDETGLIHSCSVIPVDKLGAPTATRQGLLTAVELRLTGSPCDVTAPLRFTHEAGGYYLRSSRPAGGPCPASLMESAVRLNLRAPIDASSVSVLLGAAAATQLPTQQLDCGGQLSVNDHSGLMQSCEDAGTADRHSQDPNVSNPNGDPHKVHIWWGLSESITETYVDVYRTSDDAYYISVVNVASPNAFFRPDAHAVDLVFDVPVPASTVTLRTYSGAPASTTPSLSPSPSPSPTAQTSERALECASTMTLTDTTGAVIGCSDTGGLDYHSQDAHISVDPGQPSVLHIWWGQSYCTVSYEIDVSPAPSDLPQPADYDINVSTQNKSGCDVMPDAHGASIDFGSPVDAARVRLVINDQRLADPVPCVPAPGLLAAGDGVNIYDSTDLITSCTQRQPNTGSAPTVSNLSDSSLVVRWPDRPCGVPIHLLFDPGNDGFVLSKPGQCLVSPLMTYEIVINFTHSVSAASVDASSLPSSN